MDIDQQKAVLKSVRHLGQQVAALERAVEQEAPGSDILVLLLSARKSLNVVVREMLELTVHSYMSQGESTQSRINTLVALLRSYLR